MSENNNWTQTQQGTQTQAANDAANGFKRDVQNLPSVVQQNYNTAHSNTTNSNQK